MILAARQLGWAHSTPSGQEGKRGDRTRSEIVRDNGGDVEMPGQSCPHMYEWFIQAGPSLPGAMGAVPLDARELAAWSQLSGVDLLPWEFAALRDASRAYCSELNKAADWPPYGDSEALYDDDVVAEKLARGLERLT